MTRWIEIGALNDIPRLGSRVVRTASGDIAVFRSADDDVFALDDRCPHKGGPLSQGIVHNKRVTCPLHNFVIELASGEAVAPDTGCTRVHPTKVENGMVWLSLRQATKLSPVEGDSRFAARSPSGMPVAAEGQPREDGACFGFGQRQISPNWTA